MLEEWSVRDLGRANENLHLEVTARLAQAKGVGRAAKCHSLKAVKWLSSSYSNWIMQKK